MRHLIIIAILTTVSTSLSAGETTAKKATLTCCQPTAETCCSVTTKDDDATVLCPMVAKSSIDWTDGVIFTD